MEKMDKPLTRFDQIKSCETPEDMVVILNGNELRFCPKGYKAKPVHCEEPCGRCISNWLKEPTRPRFSPEEVADARSITRLIDGSTAAKIERTEIGALRLMIPFSVNGKRVVDLDCTIFPSLRPGQSIAMEDVIEGVP